MNDELSGQLTSDWIIPPYARDMLWLEGDGGVIQVQGEYGLFELHAPSSLLTLRWRAANGPALVQIPWQADSLEWGGSVRIAGYVDALHVTTIPDTDMMVTVIYMGGQPLHMHATPFPVPLLRQRHSHNALDFHQHVTPGIPETFTTWIVAHDNPLAAEVRRALVDNLRLHLWGQLADEASGWGEHFALPIVLQGVTLFAP